jgi:hypothetical protein
MDYKSDDMFFSIDVRLKILNIPTNFLYYNSCNLLAFLFFFYFLYILFQIIYTYTNKDLNMFQCI